MSIKIGDRVKVKKSGKIGTIERAEDHFYEKLVIVRFEDNSLEKMFLGDVEPVRDSINLTREEFTAYMSKVVDRETFEGMDDTTYQMLQVTATLIGQRLEVLLFGNVQEA